MTSSTKQVLIAGVVHPVLIEMLEAGGYRCRYEPKLEQADFERLAVGCTGLVVRSHWLRAELIDRLCPTLEFVGRVGSGLERIDVAHARSRGVRVLSSPEGNCQAVAEHTIGVMLSLLHRVPAGNEQLRRGVFERAANSGRELRAQTVGLIGMGNVGSAVANKLSGLGCRVLGYDKYRSDYGAEIDNPNFVECGLLDELLAEANVVSLHLPETPETDNYVDVGFMANVRHSIYFINTARGNQVSLTNLANWLQNRKILGLALDVFPTEPPGELQNSEAAAYHYLLQTPERVLLTPHIAGLSDQSFYELAYILAEKVLQSH